nr:MAG TPA: hypothetical protein [Caudoviricetes sp.]
MKQTLEEAANQNAEIEMKKVLNVRATAKRSFIAGVEWQKKQSPWISVKDMVPIPVIEAIDGNEYGSIDVLGSIKNSYGDYYCICRYWGYNKEYRWENGIVPDYWMPIPKFNEE